MKKYFLIIGIFICSSFLFAQTPAPAAKLFENPNNRIGFSGSMISGWGLTYQRNFNPIAVKAVAFYYYYKDGTGNLSNQVITGPAMNFDQQGSIGSFGLEFKYYVFESKYVNLYPLIGFSYWLENTETPSYYWDKNNKEYSILRESKSNTWNLGAGFGIEVIAGKYVAFNFDIGMKYLNTQKNEHNYESPPVIVPTEDIYFGIAVGGGVSFVF